MILLRLAEKSFTTHRHTSVSIQHFVVTKDYIFRANAQVVTLPVTARLDDMAIIPGTELVAPIKGMHHRKTPGSVLKDTSGIHGCPNFRTQKSQNKTELGFFWTIP